jgi:ATP-binding cassette subfamily B (MDR/TAP) protein 1
VEGGVYFLFTFKCSHILISKTGVPVFQVGRAGLALTEEQKIKLSIARAVLLNPSILLLDEVTGGLDFEAERAVHEALDMIMLGRSTIIIARRLSLIRNADYIAVMEEGQLVEMGTHDELLNLNGLYAELLRGEEAAKLPKRYLNKSHSFLCHAFLFVF